MPSFGIVNSTQLNLRARPTTESEIVRVLSRDTNLEIVRDAGFNWLEVKVLPEGQRGFVSKLYVRITNTPDGGGGTPSPTPEPLTGQGEVTASALNIRSAPSLSALVLMSVKQGTRLNLIEKIGDWIKIRLDDGREAFAAAQFVNLKPASSPSPTRSI
ncbi:MAG: SH3 domain-containing protein, partial [Anaerolinea sp.]|nr:SH3 domain-containing protein [Anaerolinea sp.]